MSPHVRYPMSSFANFPHTVVGTCVLPNVNVAGCTLHCIINHVVLAHENAHFLVSPYRFSIICPISISLLLGPAVGVTVVIGASLGCYTNRHYYLHLL